MTQYAGGHGVASKARGSHVGHHTPLTVGVGLCPPRDVRKLLYIRRGWIVLVEEAIGLIEVFVVTWSAFMESRPRHERSAQRAMVRRLAIRGIRLIASGYGPIDWRATPAAVKHTLNQAPTEQRGTTCWPNANN